MEGEDGCTEPVDNSFQTEKILMSQEFDEQKTDGVLEQENNALPKAEVVLFFFKKRPNHH
jgi:hypothetical protein